MRTKLLLVGLAAVVLIASSAVAAPPAGKGKPLATGAGCKPKVAVVLKGTLTEAPLSVDVTGGNRWGRAYVEGSASTSIAVDANTKVRRQGEKVISGSQVATACSFRRGSARLNWRTMRSRL